MSCQLVLHTMTPFLWMRSLILMAVELLSISVQHLQHFGNNGSGVYASIEGLKIRSWECLVSLSRVVSPPSQGPSFSAHLRLASLPVRSLLNSSKQPENRRRSQEGPLAKTKECRSTTKTCCGMLSTASRLVHGILLLSSTLLHRKVPISSSISRMTSLSSLPSHSHSPILATALLLPFASIVAEAAQYSLLDAPSLALTDIVQFFYLEASLPYNAPPDVSTIAGTTFIDYSVTTSGLGIWDTNTDQKFTIQFVCNNFFGGLLPVLKPGERIEWANAGTVNVTSPIEQGDWINAQLITTTSGEAYAQLISYLLAATNPHNLQGGNIFATVQPVTVAYVDTDLFNSSAYGAVSLDSLFEYGTVELYPSDSFTFMDNVIAQLHSYGCSIGSFLGIKGVSLFYLSDTDAIPPIVEWNKNGPANADVYHWYSRLEACLGRLYVEAAGTTDGAEYILANWGGCYNTSYAYVYNTDYSVFNVSLIRNATDVLQTPQSSKYTVNLPTDSTGTTRGLDVIDYAVSVLIMLLAVGGVIIFTVRVFGGSQKRRRLSFESERVAGRTVKGIVGEGSSFDVDEREYYHTRGAMVQERAMTNQVRNSIYCPALPLSPDNGTVDNGTVAGADSMYPGAGGNAGSVYNGASSVGSRSTLGSGSHLVAFVRRALGVGGTNNKGKNNNDGFTHSSNDSDLENSVNSVTDLMAAQRHQDRDPNKSGWQSASTGPLPTTTAGSAIGGSTNYSESNTINSSGSGSGAVSGSRSSGGKRGTGLSAAVGGHTGTFTSSSSSPSHSSPRSPSSPQLPASGSAAAATTRTTTAGATVTGAAKYSAEDPFDAVLKRSSASRKASSASSKSPKSPKSLSPSLSEKLLDPGGGAAADSGSNSGSNSGSGTKKEA